MTDPGGGDLSARRVAAVRHFNRFYTRRIGILNDAILGSEFSLAEMRVLWEAAHRGDITVSGLQAHLGMDQGYVSRIVRALRDRGWVRTETSGGDARVRHLQVTPKGAHALGPLERKSSGRGGRAHRQAPRGPAGAAGRVDAGNRGAAGTQARRLAALHDP